MPAWLRYTLIRLVLFAVPLAVLLFLGVFWLWAALVATVVAFCLSFIFLRGQRDAVATDWANRRPRPTRDDEAEDAEIAAAESGSGTPTAPTAPADAGDSDDAGDAGDSGDAREPADSGDAREPGSAGEGAGDEGRSQA